MEKVKRLYLMHGVFDNGGKAIPYTGLYYDHSPPILLKGDYTEITTIEERDYSTVLKPGADLTKLLLIKQGWLFIRSYDIENPSDGVTLSITYRIIYPYCTYYSGSRTTLLHKYQDYMIMKITLKNSTTDKTANLTFKLTNAAEENTTYSVIGGGVTHTVFIPERSQLVRVKDLSPFILGKV